MAKKPAPAKEEVKETKTTAAAEPKYTVDSLVEASGLQPASVRVALRELGVEKNFGNKYGWDKKSDFDEIVKSLKERSAKNSFAKNKEVAAKEEAAKTTKGKDAKAPAKGGKKK